MSFVGFGQDALPFWDGLAQDNTKSYWHAHKPTFDAAVAGPLAALVEDLTAEFGDIHRFRPQRDVRFSPDKRPYQEFCSMAATSTHPTGGVFYLQLGLDGLMVAGGAWQPDTATLTRFREAIDDEDVAASFDLARQEMLDAGSIWTATYSRPRRAAGPATTHGSRTSVCGIWLGTGRSTWSRWCSRRNALLWSLIPGVSWTGGTCGWAPTSDHYPAPPEQWKPTGSMTLAQLEVVG